MHISNHDNINDNFERYSLCQQLSKQFISENKQNS